VIEPVPSAASLDHAMTADRDEDKYVIGHDRTHALLRLLDTQLSAHRFSGEGANRLPDAQHYSTTVYFDTASRALFRAARDNPERNAKLRAREYYDLHSSLAELATDPAQIVRYQPWLFLELKRREGARTLKQRVRLPKAQIAAFFDSGGFAGSAAGELEEAAERAAFVAFCASLNEPLSPSCVVNYRRLAFEDAQATLRVTVDLDVAFYTPPADLWQRGRALVRGSFGRAVGTAPGCLVEVKRRAAEPAWLSRALEELGARREAYSKFSEASMALLRAEELTGT
jgi:hypothetical protein